MGHEAIGVDLMKARIAGFANQTHAFGHGVEELRAVPGVGLGSWDAEGLGAIGDAAGEGLRLTSGLSEEVVLADEEDGELPFGSNVHRFVEGTFAEGSVADVDD